MSNKYFYAKVPHICNLPELQYSDNKQILYSLDEISNAIKQKQKISFVYNEYGTDFKLHPRRDIVYIVNPYQLVANNGRYYLIGNYDKYNNISHYRIDKMTEVKILEESIKPINQLEHYEDGLDLPKHMAEHIYMFSGESIYVKLIASKDLMSELVDWFGKDFRIMKEDEKEIIVRVKCNENAMKFWALQYGAYVKVLEPESLKESIMNTVKEMYEKYIN